MSRLALVVTIGVAFGSGSVANRFAIAELPALTVSAARLVVASLLFAALLLVRRPPLPRGHELLPVALVGLGYVALPVMAFTAALRYISSGVQGVLFALLPLATAAIAHRWVPGERLTGRRLLGLLIGLAGVVALVASHTDGIGAGAFDARGYVLTLLGVLSVAAAVVFGRRRLGSHQPLAVAAVQTFVGALLTVPVALVASSAALAGVASAPPLTLGVLAYLGMAASTLPFLATFTLVRRHGATDAALPGYLIPVVAASLGALLLGEQVTPALLGGGALVLASVLIVTRAPTDAGRTARR